MSSSSSAGRGGGETWEKLAKISVAELQKESLSYPSSHDLPRVRPYHGQKVHDLLDFGYDPSCPGHACHLLDCGYVRDLARVHDGHGLAHGDRPSEVNRHGMTEVVEYETGGEEIDRHVRDVADGHVPLDQSARRLMEGCAPTKNRAKEFVNDVLSGTGSSELTSTFRTSSRPRVLLCIS